jgi:hypothetical protein
MCSAIATSKEHVPPRNLFPEAGECAGIDYRKNLITVPSCDNHNVAKSNDDEFLMVSLAGIIGNNSIGYMHKLGKVDRAIRLSANRLLDELLVKKEAIYRVEVLENQFIDIIWGTPDVVRLIHCFEHIAYGLHRYHFKRNFSGRVSVMLGYIYYKQHNPRTWTEFIRDRAEIDLKDQPKLGSNPDVFYYQLSTPDQFGLYMMRLCFYGGLQVHVTFAPEGSRPPQNIAVALIERGVRTVISLADKKFEFNPKEDT